MGNTSAPRAVPETTDRKILELLQLLSSNPMIVVSGTRMAKQIGVSRHTVRHWVNKLRALGVDVKGHPRTGYHLQKSADVLIPAVLRRRLEGIPFGKHMHHFFTIGSTNDAALDMGHSGAPHGTVVLAEQQTAGRGRVGHAWHSEKSHGIYMSVLLRPGIAPVEAPLITLVAGLAARDAVAEQTGAEPDLRWPNDLMLGGKKFGGILTEMHAEPDRVKFVVVGIGINVNHETLPADIRGLATSLRMETGRAQSRNELVVRVLRALDAYYNQFLRQGGEAILRRFSEVSSYCEGKRVRVATARETFLATTAGLDSAGVLRVRRENGKMEPVLAGDVREA
ncbi:MAG TPA: biotin--[acetyl-CoA-carboxylase] ligase [Candidatus Acidoferrales bacterium]|nr:biotin--[acetyl-CoA-carboxylase] ligase [Candidatus Acidoferrales bacterium]